MKALGLQVSFLKGVADLTVGQGFSTLGVGTGTAPYVYEAPDGNAYLFVSNNRPGRWSRYHFLRNEVGGSFPTEQHRDKFMGLINSACGETVVVSV